MGICGRLLSLYRREEAPVDKRGKACLANGELYTIKYSPHLRVKDVCIEIARQLNIAPVALDFFTLMTTDCEHCLRPNRQITQQCDKQNDHYLNPKRVLHAEEIASKVFFLRLAFKAVAGPDLKVVNAGAYEYFVMQCRWDYINGRINNLSRKDHLTLLVLESIIRSHEEGISCKDILDNPKRFGLAHLFVDDEYSCREIKSHLKKQLSQFKTAQNNIDKAKNSFLYVLEGVTDFGVTKIVVKKFYYQSASEDVVYPVEWEILISPNGLKKRRTYKDERGVDSDDTTGSNRVDEMISDYKDIEYLEIKQSESDEIIHISRQKGFLEVISVGKSMIKKESLITLIEGFYHLFVNQYKTLTKYEPGLELPLSSARQTRKLHIHGPIERKKVEVLLKAVETENGDRSGVHMIRRSRKEFNSYVLSFIYGNEIKHYEIVHANDKYGIKNGPAFDNMTQLLEFYKTQQTRFPAILTKYCPIPKEGLCALYDDQIVVEAPCVPSTSRPANPEYLFEYIGNLQLDKLSHTFTCGNIGDRIFKARWLKGDQGGCQEVFCRRIETSRAPNFREKVVKIGENMAKLVHRNLVQFHGVQFNDDQNTFLAFEWINSGTLDDYLKKETEVKMETILTFAAQIAEACMYLHEKNYVHGWLAAHNVLIVNEEQVKLSDVSVPCLREEDMLCETVNINRSPWKARECFQGRRYSKESDVWAFGIVLWEMFMKTVPFQNMDDDTILQIFQQDRHLAYPRWCPEEVGKIMKSCWITEPTQRPTFAQIVMNLRQIMGKLKPQEKERKIPETIDEKFTIEPLNIKKDKPSLTPPDDNMPCTSSCGSHDNPDGAVNDTGSNEGSYMTGDSELDFIPEKESPEMLWSPEEIEMKRFERKYPRATVTMELPAEDSTYDRISQKDPSFETNDQTHLLASEHDSFAFEERPMNGVIMNEVQTAVDDPMKQQQHPAEVLPRDSNEDDPADDDEERPLIRKTTPSLAQPDAIFVSLKTMDHMGFLASQLGSEGALMDDDSTPTDKGSANVDKDATLMGNGCTVNSDSGIPEQESTGVPNEASTFFSGNLDPFAADSEDRANVIFSKLNSATAKNQEKSIVNCPAPRESKYVAKTRFETDVRYSGYNSGNLNPMMLKQSPNSSYVMAGTKPGNNPSSSIPKTPKNIIPTPSGARTKSREQTTTTTRVDNSHSTGNQQSSLSGIVEFSKLDPFAMSSFATSASECGEVPSNEAGLRPQQTASMYRQTVNNPSHGKISDQDEPSQDGALFSSFLDRDPMSELSVNDRKQPSTLSGRNLTSNKQNISPSANKTSTTYVAPYSLGSMAYSHNKTSSFDPGRTTFTMPKFPQTGQASNKHVNRSGYVPMRGNFRRPIASNAERESTNQKLNSKSHDGVTLDMTFSERDPFSEAIGKENKVEELNTGNSRTSGTPQDLKPRVLGPPGVNTPRPMGITGATFENLFSKSRETRSTGSATPGMGPQGLTSPSLKPPSLIPSSSPGSAPGVRVTNPSVITPQPSPPVFRAPSFGKPSLGNLALKLSESRQTTVKPGMGKQPTSDGFKPANLSSVQQQNKSKSNVSSGSSKNSVSKMSVYGAVSKSKNPDSIKTSKLHAVDERSAMPVNVPSDFASLSNQDIFSSISQCSPTDMSNTPLNLPSSASMDPFASKSSSFSGVKLVTEAESDKGPYQKISTRGNNAEEKVHYVQASGLVLGNTSSTENGGKDEPTFSAYSIAKYSSPSKRNANSNYQPDGVSTSLQPHAVDSASDRPTKDRNPVSEKPRAKTPELNSEANVLETADISQFSHTSLDDLLSSMTFQDKGKMNEVKPSQEIELNERPNQDSSTDRNIPETATENVGANEVRTGLEVDNTEHEDLAIGLTFNNRDPFAEISASQPDLNRKSPQELNVTRNSPENERGEPQQDSEIVPEVAPRVNVASQGVNLRNQAVVVISYSNASTPERSDAQVPSSPTPQENSSGSPPGGGNGRYPPPLGRKPNANRKVSDIGMDYAKVSIKPDENTSYDEPIPGAVGGVEPGPELPLEPVESVTDGDDDKIVVVDPFNMPPAKESIQKLEWKNGKKVDETFEESMKSHQIPLEYLTFERELGQGAFGVVRKAKLTRPGHGHKTRPPMEVAVKCCKDDASEIYKNSFKQEAINLMKLENKFIVRFLGVSYNEEENLLLVTELVPQGSLDKYLRDPKNAIILGNEVLLQFAIQITMGMQYLESKKLVHRDLAARNILVATESHVKISDFGLSRIYDDEYYRSHRENQRLPIRWLAPECLEQKKFTVYSDVWSLGVTLWEMFSYGKRPYEDWNFEYTSELIQVLKSGKRLPKPPACLDDVYANIQECWHLKPLARVSFFLLKTMLEDILKDKYAKKPYFM